MNIHPPTFTPLQIMIIPECTVYDNYQGAKKNLSVKTIALHFFSHSFLYIHVQGAYMMITLLDIFISWCILFHTPGFCCTAGPQLPIINFKRIVSNKITFLDSYFECGKINVMLIYYRKFCLFPFFFGQISKTVFVELLCRMKKNQFFPSLIQMNLIFI